MLDLITIESDLYVPIKLQTSVCRDPDDDKFIEVALASGCKIIVSGDKDLLDINGIFGIKVIKPADFVHNYLG